nr:hypothetical protein [Tanacetum cinerariifolium]
MREVISKVGLVDFKRCWSVIRENGISKLLEWNNALLEVILKVGLVDLMADNPKVKPAAVKEKPDDVTSKVSRGKELDVLKYKRKIEKESNALDNPNESDKEPVSESHEIQSESHEIQSELHGNAIEFGYYEHIDRIHHEDDDGDDGDDDDDGGNGNDNCLKQLGTGINVNASKHQGISFDLPLKTVSY